MNVQFNKNEGSLENILPFLKEIRKNPGCMFVFSYMGEGNMMVNVLDNEASEIQYSPLRTVPRAPVFHQCIYFVIIIIKKESSDCNLNSYCRRNNWNRIEISNSCCRQSA